MTRAHGNSSWPPTSPRTRSNWRVAASIARRCKLAGDQRRLAPAEAVRHQVQYRPIGRLVHARAGGGGDADPAFGNGIVSVDLGAHLHRPGKGRGRLGPGITEPEHHVRPLARASARRTPSASTRSEVSRRPAVSSRVTACPASSRCTSSTSRVVPGRAETMAASRPARRFSRVDFPALGGPEMATTSPSRTRSPAPRR